jgi:hypothetical protein
MVPMRTAMLVRVVVHVQTGSRSAAPWPGTSLASCCTAASARLPTGGVRGALPSSIGGKGPFTPNGHWRRGPGHAVARARRARNLPARSGDHSPNRNNYHRSSFRVRRPGRGAHPPITTVFHLLKVPRHLRRKGLAIKLQGFGAVRALKPDKTRIWRSLEFWPCGRSTVRHRERHSGHPWRWIECSAGIGPHGAVAVIKVARRVLRSHSPFRRHWD